MEAEIYKYLLIIFIGISGFTARYLFLEIKKASDRYAKEFIRVDLKLADHEKQYALHCQECKFNMAKAKEDYEHIRDKVYSDAEKLTVLIHRIERIEFKIDPK